MNRGLLPWSGDHLPCRFRRSTSRARSQGSASIWLVELLDVGCTTHPVLVHIGTSAANRPLVIGIREMPDRREYGGHPALLNHKARTKAS
jgi:hypothetical protein